MRKLMIMASMLAMVLLAASPAVAQTAGSGGDASDDSIGGSGGDATDNSTNVQYEVCQNISNVVTGDQYNNAEQTAGDDVALQDIDGDGNASEISQDEAQAIAQENNTTVTVVQQCFVEEGITVVGDGVDVGPAAEDINGDGVVDEADDVNDDGVVGEADTEAAAETGDTSATAEAGDAAASAEAGDAAASAEAGDAEAGAVAVLPDTGGASLFTLGAGALLVAGGLLARRIVR